MSNILDIFPIANFISSLALTISAYTAYANLVAKFKGRLWFADSMILVRMDRVPSIALSCFVDNSGAKDGALDDIRMTVTTEKNGVSSKFFPKFRVENYNLNKATTEWLQFSTISVPPKSRKEIDIFFRPLDDIYQPVEGKMTICLEVRWNGEDWIKIEKNVVFILPNEISEGWIDLSKPPIQIDSEEFKKFRRKTND